MKNCRVLALVIFVSMSVVYMNTLEAAGNRHQWVSSGHKPVKHKHRWGSRKRSVRLKTAQKGNSEQEAPGTRKPLDLAIPFKGIQEPAPKQRMNGLQEKTDSSLFENKNRQAELQVKGHFVMSQEQEADKRRSADGAGIMINLRR